MPKIKVNNPKNIIKGTPTRYYFKLHNTGGPKGDKGDTGDTGPQGPKGDTGNAATVQVGSTTTLPVGQDATVENVGNQYAAILNFGIPQGPQGPQGVKGDKGDTGDTGPQGATGAKGDPGTNATVYVGTTTTGNPGTQASVRNSGTENNAVLNFTIPQGATGATGPANTLSIGSVTKGVDASATITGDAPNQTLNLVLPKGDKGDTGATGAEGPRGPQGIQGETGEAFSIYKTYSSIADMNADASNVPEGKFTLIASNVDEPDNSKLFVKNGEGTFTYLTDMSGAQGIQGPAGPQGVRGDTGPVGPQGETGPRGSVKSQYVAELPATGDEDTFYLVDRDLESHTESGEYITLETTKTAAAIQSAQIDGNATQTTYSGKNLFDIAQVNNLALGETILEQSTYRGYTLKVSAGQTYTVSRASTSTPNRFRVCFTEVEPAVGADYYNSQGTRKAYDGNESMTSVTATVPQGMEYLFVYLSNLDQTITEAMQIQIEKSSSASSYEPFVGGTPAPNPEFPQPISVVTGENTVKVTGKNLWDNSQVVKGRTDNGVISYASGTTDLTVTDNSVSFTTNATWRGVVSGLINVQPNSTIYFQAISDDATMSRYIDKYDASGNWLGRITGYYGLGFTTTIPADCYGIRISFMSPTARTTVVSNIQLELGSVKSDFEPYQGQSYEVNLGKNLFDTENRTQTRSGLTCGTTSNRISIDGTATRNNFGGTYFNINGSDDAVANYYDFDTSTSGLTLPAGTYTLSMSNITGSYTSPLDVSIRICKAYSGSTPLTRLATITISNDETSATFTLPEQTTIKIQMRVQVSADTSVAVPVFADYAFNLQLEAGTQATSYSEYFPPIELAKIGTYQDRIYKDGEKWYVEKQVGKVVLDGTGLSSLNTHSGNYNTVAYTDPSVKQLTAHAVTCMSDRFVGATGADVWYGTVIGGVAQATNGNYLSFSLQSSTGSSIAEMNAYFASHPTTVYYALATPTTTEITEQTLIDQLEALASATLGYGANNIWTEIATGNAMPTLELNWVEWEKYNRHNVYIWNDAINDWQVIVQ